MKHQNWMKTEKVSFCPTHLKTTV